MSEEEGWDYGQVPLRSWSWYVKNDPSLGCPSHKTVELSPSGLHWAGDCHSPWGGPYLIGSQGFEQFLRDGPLPEQMPAEVEAELRAHLLAHRRPGARAELRLEVCVTAPGQALVRTDCELDGSYLTTQAPPAPTAEEHVLFTGALPPGAHVLGAAFTVQGRRPGVAYAQDRPYEVAAGARLVVRFEIGPQGVTVATRAEPLA